jgi:hypothetical protein
MQNIQRLLPLRGRLSHSNPVHQGSNYALPPLRVTIGSRERSRAEVHKTLIEPPQ